MHVAQRCCGQVEKLVRHFVLTFLQRFTQAIDEKGGELEKREETRVDGESIEGNA